MPASACVVRGKFSPKARDQDQGGWRRGPTPATSPCRPQSEKSTYGRRDPLESGS